MESTTTVRFVHELTTVKADGAMAVVGVVAYADHLRGLVEECFGNGGIGQGQVCTNWTDLHDICDANELLQETDDHFGVEMPDMTDEDAREGYVGFTNDAIARVEADWPTDPDAFTHDVNDDGSEVYTTSWGVLKVVDITAETGNADDYCVMEDGDPSTALAMLGWEEAEGLASNFSNPVWARDIGAQS